MKILIVGRGRVGTTLARWFEAEGMDVILWEDDPVPTMDEVDLTILAVNDAAVETAWKMVRNWSCPPTMPMVHCSGFLPARTDETAPHPQGAMHPAYSFSQVLSGRREDVCFLLDGDDGAVQACRNLLQQCRLDHVMAPGVIRPLYHAACVVSSNFLPLLGMAAESLMYKAGIKGDDARRLIFSLFDGVLRNARDNGFRAAISGPASRGDAETVLLESQQVGEHAPDFLPLFLEGNRSLGAVTGHVDVAKRLLAWAKTRLSQT